MTQCYHSQAQRFLQGSWSHITAFGSIPNDPWLSCFMDFCVWILHHIPGVSACIWWSFMAFGIWGGSMWRWSVNIGAWMLYYTASVSFCLTSGFLLGFTHFKSLCWLVKQSVSKTPLHNHFVFRNCLKTSREDFWSREMFLNKMLGCLFLGAGWWQKDELLISQGIF